MAGKMNRGDYWQPLPGMHLCTWLTSMWAVCLWNQRSALTLWSSLMSDHGTHSLFLLAVVTASSSHQCFDGDGKDIWPTKNPSHLYANVLLQTKQNKAHTHTHNCFSPSWILSGTTKVSRHQKGKTNLDLLEQERVSGSGISWAICKSDPGPRHITMSASLHSVFYRPDALPAAKPTASKH